MAILRSQRKNYSLDMILPAKWIATIVKQIKLRKKSNAQQPGSTQMDC